MIELDRADVASLLRTPGESDNKYRRGVVTLLTGGESYPGAGVLSVAGAARSGAGLIRYAGPSRAEVLARFPEVVLGLGRGAAGCDAAVIGCGWDESLAAPTRELLAELDGDTPVVLDAGALAAADFRSWPGPRILTPHYGEAAQLLERLEPGTAVAASQITADPEAAARTLARLTGSVVVLKGAWTHVVSPEGTVYGFRGLTAWAGVAGSGDVLAGVVGALLAQRAADRRHRAARLDVARTAAAAVWLHGHAAAAAAGCAEGTGGGHPILAQDIAAAIPLVWQQVG